MAAVSIHYHLSQIKHPPCSWKLDKHIPALGSVAAHGVMLAWLRLDDAATVRYVVSAASRAGAGPVADTNNGTLARLAKWSSGDEMGRR
jgi:hypothetical protein